MQNVLSNEEVKNLYYDPNDLLSYNRILNFLIGARGIGKSYAFKKYPINRFLRHGEQFIYVRRYKTELRKVGNYFDDIKQEFPDNKFEVKKGREFWIDGKLAGWAIPLSTWQSEKSNAYPNVNTIIFDEFIREKDNSGYMPNEVSALMNLMDTVFRDRDNVRCICLSNAVSVVNPYFTFFNLYPDIDKRFNANENIVVEIPDSAEFSARRRLTKFGKLIDGTDYGDMSLDNKFNDNTVFVEKRSKESRYQFSIVYQGMTIGIWVDVERGLMYMSNDHDPSSRHVYALSTEDLKENVLLLTSWKGKNFHLSKMVSAFKKGYLRFDNQVLRSLGYEVFRKMNIY